MAQNGFDAISGTCGESSFLDIWVAAFKGKSVTICYDLDEAGEKGASRAAGKLAKVAKEIKIVTLPPELGKGGDISDFFKAGHTADDLKKLIADTKPLKAEELKEKKVKGKYFIDGVFCPDKLAREIIAENDLLHKPSTGFYKYNQSGLWEEMPNEAIKNIIDKKLVDKSKKARIHDALELVVVKSYTDKELNPDRNLLNLKNGMFNLSSYELLPHSKDYYSTIQLNVTYDRKAKCKQWLTFLNEILGGDKNLISIIQEFMGYCLVPDTRYEKLLILIGEGSNGKSTLIALIIALIGKWSVSTISLTNLEKEFHRVSLYSKLVNVSTEFEISELLTSGYLKSIVSGDAIDACYKFKDAFSFNPFVRLIVAMNDLPRVKDTSFGFYRRLMIIPFNKRFEGEAADKRLKTKLLEDLDGIFLWALEGLKRLYKNDCFTESETVSTLIKDYQKSNNPVAVFLDECCEMETSAQVGKGALYENYKEFSRANGFRKINNVNFSKELRRVIPSLTDRKPHGGQREWVGVRLLKG